jgi:hypothetical protein
MQHRVYNNTTSWLVSFGEYSFSCWSWAALQPVDIFTLCCARSRPHAATVFQEVDLGATGWQPITGGLYVIDLAAAPAGKGMKVSGKVINPTSVTHESAQLSVRVGEHRATFTLAHLPPAVAQPFEVTLPEVPAASTRKLFFALDGSTINFASSATRKRSGGEPVDTDKLLH